MDWAELLQGISLPSVTWSAIGGLAILGVLTRKLITIGEHRETLARITALEQRLHEERATYLKDIQEERDAHGETRDTLREVATQNGALIAAAQISTEVMKRIDQRAQEGGST
jgi:hypothetical protein